MRSAGSASALLCAVLVGACAPAPASIPLKAMNLDAVPLKDDPEASRVPPPAADRGVDARLPGEERPSIVKTFTVDYGTLPLLENQAVSSAPLRTLSIAAHPVRLEVPKTWLAQANIGAVSIVSEPDVTGGPFLRLESDLRARGTGASTCVDIGFGAKPLVWEAVRLEGWTADEVEYVRYEGTVDPKTCVATAKKASRVTAKAVIPSLLYAFRECIGECTGAKGEQLVNVIGPASQWVTSSAPWPAEQLKKHAGEFSRARIPLKQGGSASVSMNANHAVIHSFVSRHKKVEQFTDDGQKLLSAHRVVQLGIDFVWPAREDSANGFGFVGGAGGNATAGFLSSMGIVSVTHVGRATK